MKRILLLFLLIFSISLTIYSEVKYEFRNNILYEDGKPATGMFELKHGKYRMSGEFLNGMPNGIFDGYFDNKRILTRDVYKKGKVLKQEVFYKNGSLLAKMSNGNFELYFDDGQPLISLNKSKKTTIVYHENGKPMMITNEKIGETTLYDENNEIIFKLINGKIANTDGVTTKRLENGLFQILKYNRVVTDMDTNNIVNYYYSTGEIMFRTDLNKKTTEFLLKNGRVFLSGTIDKQTLYYKNRKQMFEINKGVAELYDESGEKIINDFSNIMNIKKIN